MKQETKEPQLPAIGTFVAVEYPEIDADVWYEFGEYCGRVIRRDHDRIQVFFPFEDGQENAVWLQQFLWQGVRKWKDCSTPALVKVKPASAEQANHAIKRISEERWKKLLDRSKAKTA